MSTQGSSCPNNVSANAGVIALTLKSFPAIIYDNDNLNIRDIAIKNMLFLKELQLLSFDSGQQISTLRLTPALAYEQSFLAII